MSTRLLFTPIMTTGKGVGAVGYGLQFRVITSQNTATGEQPGQSSSWMSCSHQERHQRLLKCRPDRIGSAHAIFYPERADLFLADHGGDDRDRQAGWA